MSRQYTHVQELLPSVLAMKGEGCMLREIANHFGLTKEQIKELCKRARRKERKIAKGYLPKPKGRPRKMLISEEEQKQLRMCELEMQVELQLLHHQDDTCMSMASIKRNQHLPLTVFRTD